MPPSISPTRRGTLASIVTVVMTFEGFLKSCLQKILKPDINGTAFLRLQQMAKLLSKKYYNDLAGYTTERKVAALIEKARNANEEQLLNLLDFIKEKLGDNASLRIFRYQILHRPMIAVPHYNRTQSRLDSAMAKQMEKSQVLKDCLQLSTKEALREAEVIKEAGARAEALQNENTDLRAQMEHFKDLCMELKKTKKENAKLAQQLKLEKTSANLAAQLEEQKKISRENQAEADRQQARADKQQERADNLETHLQEVEIDLEQAREDLDDKAKELEKKNIELEQYKKKLDDAMDEIGGLKGELKDLKQQFEDEKDENKSLREMTREALAGMAALREENKQLFSIVGPLKKKAQIEESRVQFGGARTSFDRLVRSLPSAARLNDGCTVLPLITKKKAWEKKDLEEDKYEDEDSFP